jgi:aspartyl-tRNA(Asn)/glutamyl-tRNA(Gln) amidotransferase subunit C
LGVTLQDVEHIAKLARLELTDEEKETFTEQMNALLRYAEKLNELQTDDVEPTTHVLPVVNVMREDQIRPSWPLEEVLKNAPEQEEGQFLVPPVLE